MLGIEVAEPCELAVEIHLDRARRAVPLFGDDDIGQMLGPFQPFFPSDMALGKLAGFLLSVKKQAIKLFESI